METVDIGVTVIRGPKPHDPRTGKILRIVEDEQGRRRARVAWNSYPRLRGGIQVVQGWARLDTLLPATIENVEVARRIHMEKWAASQRAELERRLARAVTDKWTTRIWDRYIERYRVFEAGIEVRQEPA